MLKTPDDVVNTNDDPITIDEIEPSYESSSSPYAKRHAKQNYLNVTTNNNNNNNSDTSDCDGWTSKHIGEIYSESHMSDTNTKSVLTIYDYDYSPAKGSPYSRRYPAQNR